MLGGGEGKNRAPKITEKGNVKSSRSFCACFNWSVNHSKNIVKFYSSKLTECSLKTRKNW